MAQRIRDAQTIIGSLEGGQLAAELSTEITETLAELKEHVADRPKAKAKGSVTLKIDFEVENGTALVSGEISSKRPKKPRDRDFFFLTDDGALSNEHPRQQNMFDPPHAVETDTEAAE